MLFYNSGKKSLAQTHTRTTQVTTESINGLSKKLMSNNDFTAFCCLDQMAIVRKVLSLLSHITYKQKLFPPGHGRVVKWSEHIALTFSKN